MRHIKNRHQLMCFFFNHTKVITFQEQYFSLILLMFICWWHLFFSNRFWDVTGRTYIEVWHTLRFLFQMMVSKFPTTWLNTYWYFDRSITQLKNGNDQDDAWIHVILKQWNNFCSNPMNDHKWFWRAHLLQEIRRFQKKNDDFVFKFEISFRK